MDINAPPIATSLDDRECISTIAGICTTVAVRGDNFVDNADVSCHLTEVEVSHYLIRPSLKKTVCMLPYDILTTSYVTLFQLFGNFNWETVKK